MAEKLTSREIFCQGTAVHCNEWLILSGTIKMNTFCNRFLTGTTLTIKYNTVIGWSYQFNLFQKFQGSGAFPGNKFFRNYASAVFSTLFCFWFFRFSLINYFLCFKRLIDGLQYFIRVKWLGDVVKGTHFN